jgi:hypothetical protein
MHQHCLSSNDIRLLTEQYAAHLNLGDWIWQLQCNAKELKCFAADCAGGMAAIVSYKAAADVCERTQRLFWIAAVHWRCYGNSELWLPVIPLGIRSVLSVKHKQKQVFLCPLCRTRNTACKSSKLLPIYHPTT